MPECASHFGGIWEAAVKSLKYHLRRVIADTKLTFEELTTILTQVEACLNSRPLTSLPRDPDSVEALTPGHYLIWKPLQSDTSLSLPLYLSASSLASLSVAIFGSGGLLNTSPPSDV